ncbi:TctA family transporter [Chromohalobacter marismortui]|uniref:TctA family transporter n=1 Tax=Chromohalobacter marismortui TaxID=42055 RepID=A0A4R7NMP4_9GAMM|nr:MULTISPECIES: tripartite tricarboxylate transporter permease [Chromohalobacter]MCI0509995.1 tripartite tricarboxylate transporter permease [Chromohalobacter sp.]MCI0593284.1 tripartite tricarboxylate transporter permease [Chromohalobacter sp.]TDU22104.1 TctA family transporter [Chromohalobacter marismortui]
MSISSLIALFSPASLAVIAACTLYGTFIGAMPGLTATMAVALLVPFTYFMDPMIAISAIVATTTTAIFAGDVPGTLMRIPGTPASAAYVEDAYRLSRAGRSRSTLMTSLFAACIGGLVGVALLALIAPQLARVAMQFSSFETFWLACLGLSCAVLTSNGSVAKSFASLFIGLFIATIGIGVAVGYPRFTFGYYELFAGISFIPAIIGLFALSEILRSVQTRRSEQPTVATQESFSQALREAADTLRGFKRNIARSSILGTLIGALPGAGADIAAWICYAISRRFSSHPERYGTGYIEGVADGGAANNAAIGGAWTPALVFGIPGDSVTAIAIGILLLNGMSPGPQIFTQSPELVHTLYGAFALSNLAMLPAGLLVIMASSHIVRIPRRILMPIVLLFSLVGAYAITNSVVAIWTVLALGALGYVMEANGFPLAPTILGIVLGGIVEDNFMTSMLKAQGDLLAFFERPWAAALGILTLLVWALLLWRAARDALRRRSPASPKESHS